MKRTLIIAAIVLVAVIIGAVFLLYSSLDSLIEGAIEKYGSILAASKSLNMSYRAAWGKIKTTEQRLGKPLLARQVGGVSGGGSQLTPFGKALVKKFEYLQSLVEKEADLFFREHFNVELDNPKDSSGSE